MLRKKELKWQTVGLQNTSNALFFCFFVFEQTENPLEKLVEVAYLLCSIPQWHKQENNMQDSLLLFFGLLLGL